jgi:hypothetical protein
MRDPYSKPGWRYSFREALGQMLAELHLKSKGMWFKYVPKERRTSRVARRRRAACGFAVRPPEGRHNGQQH